MLAYAIGDVAGAYAMRRDRSIFYGPLTDLIAAGAGPTRFVTAYVLTDVEHGDGLLGHQGLVTNLVRDDDQYPVKVMLKNASIFHLRMPTAP